MVSVTVLIDYFVSFYLCLNNVEHQFIGSWNQLCVRRYRRHGQIALWSVFGCRR